MTPNGKTPRTTNTWLAPLYQFLDWFLALLTAGGKMYPIDAVFTAALPAVTYANGTSGVGATLTFDAAGVIPPQDGYTPQLGDVLLIAGQTLAHCGLYVVTTLGTASVAAVLTRDTRFDASADIVPGTRFGVKNGTLHAGKVWAYTGVASPTVGSTALPFAGTAPYDLVRGSIPASRMAYSANPANNDTITIGGHVFKFVTSLAAANTFTQVKVLGSAALSLAALLDAINGVTNTANVVQATTPFSASVIADAVTATSLRLRLAASRGNRAIAGVSGSLVLAASITAGAAAWSIANLNAYGKVNTDAQRGEATITITSAMITATAIDIEFPFPVGGFQVQALTSTGAARYTVADLFTASGNAVHVALDGGVAPSLQNTDVLTVRAWA
jgi:hypothetical protein